MLPREFAILRARVESEEKCISPSLAECISLLVELDTGDSANTTQKIAEVRKTVNDFIYTLARKYTSDLGKFSGLNPSDGYVYPVFKLFPITTLDWILAVVEIFITYGKYCQPTARKVREKVSRVIAMRYPSHAQEMIQEIERIRLMHNDMMSWQSTLYDIVGDIVDMSEYYIKYEDNPERMISTMVDRSKQIISEVFKFSWSNKQVRQVKYDIINICSSQLPSYTKKSILFFKIVSLMAL